MKMWVEFWSVKGILGGNESASWFKEWCIGLLYKLTSGLGSFTQ